MIKNLSSRAGFYYSFVTKLVESPMKLWPSALRYDGFYQALVEDIEELKKAGAKVEKIGDLNRIPTEDGFIYWLENDGVISLGVQVQKRDHGYVVIHAGKNPDLKGKAPFASDLYIEILKNLDSRLRLMSDEAMSDEGIGIWKHLLAKGCNISVYDSTDASKIGDTLTKVTPENIDTFIGGSKHAKYQFVLSDSPIKEAALFSLFKTRRLRELYGEVLDEKSKHEIAGTLNEFFLK